MASAGTLISDLDSKPPLGDDDLVRQIYADMNSGSGMQQQPQQQYQPPPAMGPPPPQLNSYRIQQPNANTIYNASVDPVVPTAHMIGGQAPNPADFASLMNANGQGTPYISAAATAAYQQQQYLPQLQQQQPQGSTWKTTLFEQLKQPLLVTILVFIVSLPAVNILFQHYAPSLLRSGGDLNNSGLLVRASLVGAAFWLFQHIIAPLLA